MPSAVPEPEQTSPSRSAVIPDIRELGERAPEPQREHWLWLLDWLRIAERKQIHRLCFSVSQSGASLLLRGDLTSERHRLPNPALVSSLCTMLSTVIDLDSNRGDAQTAGCDRTLRFSGSQAVWQLDARTWRDADYRTLDIELIEMPGRAAQLDTFAIHPQTALELRRDIDGDNGWLAIIGPGRPARTRLLQALMQERVGPDQLIVATGHERELRIAGTRHAVMGRHFSEADERTWQRHWEIEPDAVFLGEAIPACHEADLRQRALESCLVTESLDLDRPSRVLAHLRARGASEPWLAETLISIVQVVDVPGLCTHCSRGIACAAADTPDSYDGQTRIGDWLAASLRRPWLDADGCDSCAGTGRADRITLVDRIGIDSTQRQLLREQAFDRAASLLDDAHRRRQSLQVEALARRGRIAYSDICALIPTTSSMTSPDY